MTESHLAVGAVVRRGKDVLLVAEQADDASEQVWALPGGNVTAGEPLLGRVAQEAGFQAVTAERLVWVARYSMGGEAYEMLGFEVTGVGGHNGAGAWLPIAEAVARLERMWFAPIREPAVAYLTDVARTATLWTWAQLDAPATAVPPLANPRTT